MDTGLFDMFHDPADEDVVAVAEGIDIDLDGIGEIPVEEQRVLAEHRIDLPGLVVRIAGFDVGGDEAGQGAEQIIVEGRLVVHDRHGAAAQHIGGAHDERQPEFAGHQPRLLDRIGDAVLRLFQSELVEQPLEAVAVFGEVD